MMLIILFTTIVFIAGSVGLISVQEPASSGRMNGVEIADGNPLADGTRHA